MSAREADAVPPEPGRAWTAEIEWRDRGDRAQFVVVARPEASRRTATIAESPPLDWPPVDAASIRALGDAARGLQAQLTRAGWTSLPPGGAWYAKRFAWQPVVVSVAEPVELPVEPALFAPRPPWPESAVGRWRCEISWDAGWSSSRFQALAYPPQSRRKRPIAGSGVLPGRLMAEPDPGSEEHRRELERLTGTLRERGWKPAGAGAHWYGARFYWPHDGPPDRIKSDLEPLKRRRSVSIE